MRRVAAFAFGVLCILMVSVFLKLWFEEMKRVISHPINAWTDLQQSDCAIVLTGGPNRINEGFDLLYQKQIRKLIIAGVNPDSHLEEIFPNIVFYGDLNLEDVILEKTSKTTYGNAQQTLPLIEAMNCKDVILITSRLHMYRSLKTFRAHFPRNIQIYPRGTIGRQLAIEWNQVAIESLKSVFYRAWAY
jgi:uncharacterized SAM-binding protein YcdF (DUF218 family)